MSLWASVRRRRYPLDAGADRVRYEQWLVARGDEVLLPERTLEVISSRVRPDSEGQPLFSIVVPVFRPPLWGLERCVTSVLSQPFDDFEFKLCDDCGGDGEVLALLRRCEAIDSRIEVIVSEHNEGIANATNRALAASTGQYIIFLDHDDELAGDALEVIAAAIRDRPETDVLYSDSDKISADGRRFAPAFKPAWSPDLLCSGMYFGHVLVVRRALVEKVGGLRSSYDGSQDHDLALRVTEIAGSVVHIPRILYHWRSGTGSAATDPLAKPWAREAGRSAVAEALLRRGEQATVEQDPRSIGRYHCSRHLASGTVVTIAPILRAPASPAGIGRVVRDWEGRSRDLVATAGMAVNLGDVILEEGDWALSWASRASAALRAARTDLVVLIDPLLLPLSRQWARELVVLADRPGVGATGGCVVEGSHIVGAGLVAGLGGLVGPVLAGLPALRPGYQAMAIVQREVSALGAECILVRRDAAAILEKLPLSLSAELAVAALCFTLRRNGERVLYEPAARFKLPKFHRQTPPRQLGHSMQLSEVEWFRSEFASELAEADPYYHPALCLDDPYCRLGSAGVELPLFR
ncbi:MAG: glycosyltransferase [Acidimicrobiales bacterium]